MIKHIGLQRLTVEKMAQEMVLFLVWMRGTKLGRMQKIILNKNTLGHLSSIQSTDRDAMSFTT